MNISHTCAFGPSHCPTEMPDQPTASFKLIGERMIVTKLGSVIHLGSLTIDKWLDQELK